MIQTVKYTYRFLKDSLTFKLNLAIGDFSFSWYIVVVSELESLFRKQVFDTPFTAYMCMGLRRPPLKLKIGQHPPIKGLPTHQGLQGVF